MKTSVKKGNRPPEYPKGQTPDAGWMFKPSRNERRQKRGWHRKSRGRINAYLAGQLALLVVIALLYLGEVSK